MAAKIIVNQTAFLGDLVLGAPLFKKLRELFPKSEITLVCRKGLGQSLQSMGLIDFYFEISKNDGNSYKKTLETLKTQQFDLLLSPHQSFRSALFVWQINAKKKIGFKSWWNFLFFDERITKDLGEPEAIRQMSLIENLWPEFKALRKNLSPIPPWASMVIPMPLDLTATQNQFQLPENYICLFPGSVWATKKWTEAGYINTGKYFAEKNLSVLVMGGPGEEELCEEIRQQIPGALNLAGITSLLETTTILSGARLVVTNDSGGQHLAALSGVPTVAVFGPTIPEFGFIPWSNQAQIVENKALACRPCGKHGHKTCPIGTHVCMTSITADQVIEKARLVLK
jgi:heptosyltransferase-2